MNSELKQQKKALRAQMRKTLAQLSSQQKKSASSELCERIVHYIKTNPSIQTIATFAALPNEPDLSELHSLLKGKTFVYPLSNSDGTMEFRLVNNPDYLTTGLYGIAEPSKSATKMDLENIDLYLCPAFAYTEKGLRLGKGGGYYDRLLKNRRADSALLGVIFKKQILDSIPTEPHDIAVDTVIYA